MRGFVFTLDAVFALYVALMAATSFVMILEASSQSWVSQKNVELSRLARDAFEIRHYSPSASIPGWASESCSTAGNVGSADAVVYKSIDGGNVGAYAGIEVRNQKVCVIG